MASIGFENWFAFLATPLLAWIIALYFIKSKPKRRVLPSTALWLSVLEKFRENALWQRYRGGIFLLLQLAAVSAAIIALARPVLRGGVYGDVILVLDTSCSMLARDGSPTRFDDARTAALELLGTFAGDVRVSVLEYGDSVRMLLPFTTDLAVVRAVVSNMKARPGVSRPPSALFSLLSSVKTDLTKNVYIFSDGFEPNGLSAVLPGVRIEIRNTGSDHFNVGITAFDIMGARDSAAATVRVGNFSTLLFKGTVKLQGRGFSLESDELQIPPESDKSPGWKSAVFQNLTLLPGIVRARLISKGGTGDLLPEDDQAWLLVRDKPIKVGVVASGVTLDIILRMLSSLGHIEPVVIKPSEVGSRSSFIASLPALIVDNMCDDLFFENNVILFHCLYKSKVSSGKIITGLRLFPGDPTHPVVRFLSFPGIHVSNAVLFDGFSDGTVVLNSGDGPVIVCRNLKKYKQVLCAFPLSESDFSYKIGFPVFMTNSLRWILGDELSSAVGYHCGDRIAFPKEAKRVNIELFDPLPGAVLTSSSRGSVAVTSALDVFDEVGVYKISAQRGASSLYPVNVLSPVESRISPRGPKKVVIAPEQAVTVEQQGGIAGFWRYCALLFLLIACAEWALFSLKGA